MAASDIERIRREVSLVETARAYGVDLQEDGDEFIACCPIHGEKTPSFTIFEGRDRVWRWHCFGCGKHGDIVDFVESIKGVSKREALDILGGNVTAGHNVAPISVPVRDIYAGIEAIAQQPDGLAVGRKIVLYNPKRERSMNFVPSMVFPYVGTDGLLVGYVLRRDYEDDYGKRRKEAPMVRRVLLPSGEECWSRFPFPTPRPLYGLPSIGGDRQVIVVEGEKCRDAIFKMRRRATVSWVGGTAGVAHTDWTPLRGKDVLVWPDADGPGYQTAQAISSALADVAGRVRFFDVRKGGRRAADDF